MLQRLKFDLKDLVNEMLDQLPERVFESKTTTFYDPAIGGGQFVVEVENRLRQYGHSDKNISKRVFGYVGNRIRFNYIMNTHKLVGTYKTTLIENMEFDVVLGNPPYNEGNAGVNKSIYQKFIFSFLKSNSRFGMFVTPGGWMDSNKKEYKELRKTLKNSGLKQIKSAKNYFPSQTIQECIYYLIDTQYRGDFSLYGTTITNTYTDSIIKIRDEKDDLYDKLNNSTFPAIRGGVALYQSNKEKYRDSPEGKFCKPFICNNPQSGPKIIFVEEKYHKSYISEGKGMVIFNERWNKKDQKLTNIRYIKNASKYSFNCNILAVEVENEEIANKVINYLTSKTFRFLLGSAKSSGQALIVGKLRKLPHWDVNLNLTPAEIDLIESTND